MPCTYHHWQPVAGRIPTPARSLRHSLSLFPAVPQPSALRPPPSQAAAVATAAQCSLSPPSRAPRGSSAAAGNAIHRTTTVRPLSTAAGVTAAKEGKAKQRARHRRRQRRWQRRRQRRRLRRGDGPGRLRRSQPRPLPSRNRQAQARATTGQPPPPSLCPHPRSTGRGSPRQPSASGAVRVRSLLALPAPPSRPQAATSCPLAAPAKTPVKRMDLPYLSGGSRASVPRCRTTPATDFARGGARVTFPMHPREPAAAGPVVTVAVCSLPHRPSFRSRRPPRLRSPPQRLCSFLFMW